MLAVVLACSNTNSTENSTTDSTANTNETAAGNDDGGEAALTDYAKTLPLDKIKLPPGFTIDIYAEVENARSMALSPSGVLYVGNKDKDKVYAVKDTDGDFKADKKWVVATGLNMPNGVAFKDGDLYIAEVSRISKIAGVESKLANPPKPATVKDDYPTETHHGWKYIAFGPDGKLYVPVGAPCNITSTLLEMYGFTNVYKQHHSMNG